MTAEADGGVVGNVYDKYGTQNPIARRLMDGFLGAITELYGLIDPVTVLEVGCGEGHLADALIRGAPHRPERFLATDVTIEQRAEGLDPALEFETASIYTLPYPDDSFELVVCCEVLEHLERPAEGLAELARVASRGVIVSTPWEPVWRALNVARGKYLRDLGNTPGHIQHFSRRKLEALASTQLMITHRRTPLPWTVLLGVPRR